MDRVDVIVLGAGAAGMFCAAIAARRGRRVVVMDHRAAPGEKIRISGGGRCNFTNIHTGPHAFLSDNPKFAISALSRFTPADFIARMDQRGIAWHEKTLGQLFCDGSARQIVDMLVSDMVEAGVDLRLGVSVDKVEKAGEGYRVTAGGLVTDCASLVVATGGLSVPKTGASGFGYRLARQFGIAMAETRPGLVPLTFAEGDLAALKPLAGLSVPAAVSAGGMRFVEGLLFTHRGLSGPSILQASSYWRGDAISVDLLPGQDARDVLDEARRTRGAQQAASVLAGLMPRRLAQMIAGAPQYQKPLADLTEEALARLAAALNDWRLVPSGSEGYRTAEVTVGGVSTGELDSRSMAVRRVPGLFFIGEVVDVTGWLGGYNFQWAWSSGWAAGQVV
ncbi:MAG: NAD(P)/FAD-dependent oxidoreductase [Rhodobacteraceae bacterium]|nr:NAD(P)/FAD-dependent oxidoreductase [Paracoccaceae bacterium]